LIDLDKNATTPLDPRVRAEIVELLAEPPGNPSSVHARGRAARAIVEAARRRVAAALGAEPLGVTFTSGGTEAIALGIAGACRWLRAAGRPSGVLATAIEHPAVLELAEALRGEGHALVLVEADAQGRIDPARLRAALTEHPDVGVVAVQAANHELGNRFDVRALVAACRSARREAIVHCDAVQAFGRVEVDFAGWDVDLLSVSAHKIGGPAGAGALVHRRTAKLVPAWRGGEQERGRRAGTEPLFAIHGFGVAAELARTELAQRQALVRALHARLVAGLVALGAEIVGDPDAHVGNTVCARLPGCDGRLVLMNLDLAGICVSTGAACTSGALEPSRVVLALPRPREHAAQVVRFSLGHDNTAAEIDAVLAALPPILARSRDEAA
jgi:cysteine desulfurase